MNTISDATLARRLLETRDRGYTFGLFLRRSASRYTLLLSLYALLLTASVVAEEWMFFQLILGMLAGGLLRDIGWVRSIRRTWPFSLKVTDWGKVEQMAAEMPPPPASPAGGISPSP